MTKFVAIEKPSRAAGTGLKGSINLRIEAQTRQLIEALDNPPAPGPKLRGLLRRVPAWKA